MSDVNSLYNDGPLCDGDDTSVSSRASSRIFDDAMLSYDALSAYYQTDYDNFKGGVPGIGGSEPGDEDAHHGALGGRTSNASGNRSEGLSDTSLDKLEPNLMIDRGDPSGINLQDIRSVTESITLNFGTSRLETDLDSDV